MATLNYRERFRPADALALPNSSLLIDLDDGRLLAQAIVDTIREPLLVLDQDLRVVTANRAFYQAFRMNLRHPYSQFTGAMVNGYSELRLLLEGVAPQHAVMEAYEVERDFPVIGRRSMLLNTRELFFQKNPASSFSGHRRCHRPPRRRTRNRNLLQQKDTAAGDAAPH